MAFASRFLANGSGVLGAQDLSQACLVRHGMGRFPVVGAVTGCRSTDQILQHRNGVAKSQPDCLSHRSELKCAAEARGCWLGRGQDLLGLVKRADANQIDPCPVRCSRRKPTLWMDVILSCMALEAAIAILSESGAGSVLAPIAACAEGMGCCACQRQSQG